MEKSLQQDRKLLEMQQQLLEWYDTHARSLPWRDDPTPYRVWVSEIMLQQTRVDTVKSYFERFIGALPTIEALAGVQEQKLLKLWEGLGYYSRARNLKKAAIEIMMNHKGQFPSSTEELIKLPGIGPYSAGAIASIAYGIKVPAIDGNVLRVIARITGNRNDITQTETKVEIGEFVLKLLPVKRVGDFNQALMELGATVCLPNGAPRCEVCPVHALCTAHSQNITDQIPVKTKKKSRRIEQKTVFIIHCFQKTAIQKRSDDGLLQGLWEFPNTNGDLSLEEGEAVLREWGLHVTKMEPLQKAKHIFTHVEWHMTGYLAQVEECKSAGRQEGISQEGIYQEDFNREGMFVWASPLELKQYYTIPTAFKAYMEAAVNY